MPGSSFAMMSAMSWHVRLPGPVEAKHTRNGVRLLHPGGKVCFAPTTRGCWEANHIANYGLGDAGTCGGLALVGAAAAH